MKQIALLLLLPFLYGCASGRLIEESVISGTWAGTMEWSSNKVLEARDGLSKGTYDITLISCGKATKVLTEETGDNGLSVVDLTHMHSKHANYVFYSVNSSSEVDPDWVENQVWSIAVLAPDTSLLYWSRVVSNPKLEADEHFRSFTQGGTATLRKLSRDCL